MISLTSKHPLHVVGIVLMFSGFVIFLAAFGSHKWASYEKKEGNESSEMKLSTQSGYFGLFIICYTSEKSGELRPTFKCVSTVNNEPISVWAKVLQCTSVIVGIAFIICAVMVNVTPVVTSNEKWILVPLMSTSAGLGITGAIVFGGTFTTHITYSKLSWSFGVSLAGNGFELLAAILLIWSPLLRSNNANSNSQTSSSEQTSTTSGKSGLSQSCPTIQIGTTPVRWSPENSSLTYINTTGSRTSYSGSQDQNCSYGSEFLSTQINRIRENAEMSRVPDESPLETPDYVPMENQIYSISQTQDRQDPYSRPGQYVAMGNPSVKWTHHTEPAYVNDDDEAGFVNHGYQVSDGENMADDARFAYRNGGNRRRNDRTDDTYYQNNDSYRENPRKDEAPPTYYQAVDEGQITFKLGKTSRNNYV